MSQQRFQSPDRFCFLRNGIPTASETADAVDFRHSPVILHLSSLTPKIPQVTTRPLITVEVRSQVSTVF